MEDDPSMGPFLLRALTDAGYAASLSVSAEEAGKAALAGSPDILVTDINLPGSGGLDLARRVKAAMPACDIIIITGAPTIENAIEAVKAGAYDYMVKPFSHEALLLSVERCAEKRRLSAEIQQLKEYREELEASYSQLKALERMKDGFLSVIGHELRTPLTPITGGLQLIESTEGCGVPPKLLSSMKNGAARLSEMIDDLLLWTEMTKEPAPASPARLDLRELLSAAAEAASPLARATGVEIRLDLPREPVTATGDRVRLQAAVRHLIKNSVLFSPAGESVKAAAYSDGKMGFVRVENKGAGIPREHLKSLFDPFYQVADYLTRKTGGLGLGLSIVRQAADSHGGRVDVESGPGMATVFTLAIPRYFHPGRARI